MARAFRIDMDAASERPAGASTSVATAIGVAVLTGVGAARLEYTINVRGVDWGQFTGQPNQTASATDNVNNAHFHQAASNTNGPVRFDWKVHDVNDGDSTDDEFAATGLALDGSVPVARVHGVWETTDPISLSGFLSSFTKPALTLGGQTDFYANIHSNQFPGGAIRGQLTLLATDNGETVNGRPGVRDDILPGLGGNDTINGGDGDDTLDGGTGNDTFIGGNGNDRIDGGAGADKMNGGANDDAYFIDNASDTIIETASGGNDGATTTVSYAIPYNIYLERLSATNPLGTAAINLTGSASANTLIGTNGQNRLDGRAGTDVLQGFAGNDTYFVDNAGDELIEVAGQGTDRALASASYVLQDNHSVEIFATANDAGTTAINLTGNNLRNTITGNDGNNIIDGQGDRDIMRGGGGNDSYRVDNSSDIVIETIGDGRDRIITSVSYTLQAGREIELLTVGNLPGGTIISVNGNEFNNEIAGEGSNDTVQGRAGNDKLAGFFGNDILIGGTGKDIIIGGIGDDTLLITDVAEVVAGEMYNGGPELDTLNGVGLAASVDLSNVTLMYLERLLGFTNGASFKPSQLVAVDVISTGAITITTGGNVDLAAKDVDTPVFNLHANGNNLSLTQDGTAFTVNGANGNDVVTIFGSAGRSVLNGGAGNDVLTGGGGDDTIDGGAGNDILNSRGGGAAAAAAGGTGSDTFRFISGDQFSGMTISDFSGITAFGGGAGENDKIRFSGFGSGTYIGDAAFDGTGFQIRTPNGGGSIQIDTNGDGTQDFAINMSGLTVHTQLVQGDFQFL